MATTDLKNLAKGSEQVVERGAKVKAMKQEREAGQKAKGRC